MCHIKVNKYSEALSWKTNVTLLPCKMSIYNKRIRFLIPHKIDNVDFHKIGSCPAGNYLFKVNNRNIRTGGEIC